MSLLTTTSTFTSDLSTESTSTFDNEPITLASIISAEMTSVPQIPVFSSEGTPDGSSSINIAAYSSDINTIISSIPTLPGYLPSDTIAVSSTPLSSLPYISGYPSDVYSVTLSVPISVPSGTDEPRTGTDLSSVQTLVPTTTISVYEPTWSSIVLYSCTTYPESDSSSSTLSSSSQQSSSSSSSQSQSSSSGSSQSSSSTSSHSSTLSHSSSSTTPTTTPTPTHPPWEPTYITIYTTVYQTVCPPELEHCPYGTLPHTYTITETCTGDQNHYTPQPLPPHFTTTTTICGRCEGKPTITVTCPIPRETGATENHDGGYNGNTNNNKDSAETDDHSKDDKNNASHDSKAHGMEDGLKDDIKNAGADHSSSTSDSDSKYDDDKFLDGLLDDVDEDETKKEEGKDLGGDEEEFLQSNGAVRVRVAETFMLAVIGATLGFYIWGV